MVFAYVSLSAGEARDFHLPISRVPPIPIFPVIHGNWYENSKFSIDLDEDSAIEADVLQEIVAEGSSGAVLNSSHVFTWAGREQGQACANLKAAPNVGELTLFSSTMNVFDLPQCSIFDRVCVDFADWSTPFVARAIEAVPFFLREKTFCLVSTEQYSVHIAFEPYAAQFVRCTRDERQEAALASALPIREARVVAKFIASLVPHAGAPGKAFQIERDEWRMFWNEFFNNYATATELAEGDFFRSHEPAVYLFMRTSQCMNRDSADDSEADTNSEDNDSWYGRLMTDARGILDGSDSSDRLDSSNSSDVGNEDEDIATSDETGPVEEQKSWVQRCLEELFPIGSGGLAKAHMACAVSVADGSDPSMVPLFSREFMADEYTGQQAAFVPCGFNPAFGTFSGVKAPQCLDGTIDGIVRDTGRKNGNFEFVVFGSCEARTVYGVPMPNESTSRKQTVEGLLRMSTDESTIMEKRRKWIAEVARDDDGPLTGLTFGITVNIARMVRRNRTVDFVITNVLVALAEGVVQNLGGTADLGLYGFPKAAVETGLLALVDTMIAAHKDAQKGSRVYRAEVCALMMTLTDMACGVPLVGAGSALEFLDRAWSLKSPITTRAWPYIPQDRVNINGRSLSLSSNPTRDGVPQLLSAIYVDLYYGPKCASEFMTRALITAYPMHPNELELAPLVRTFVVDYYCPAAVRRVEIIAFAPLEDGYATLVRHLEKDEPLDDETREFLAETRPHCTRTIPVFDCAEVMFGVETDEGPASEAWMEIRQLLIQHVGMERLSQCAPGVLADASIRILPSFRSEDPMIFLVGGQPSPEVAAAAATAAAQARGHPFNGLDLNLPLRVFPIGLARALREVESNARLTGKAPPGVLRYVRLVQTYVRTVSFRSHPEMQAFVLTAYILTLQPRDLPKVSAVRGCRLEPHPKEVRCSSGG